MVCPGACSHGRSDDANVQASVERLITDVREKMGQAKTKLLLTDVREKMGQAETKLLLTL